MDWGASNAFKTFKGTYLLLLAVNFKFTDFAMMISMYVGCGRLVAKLLPQACMC